MWFNQQKVVWGVAIICLALAFFGGIKYFAAINEREQCRVFLAEKNFNEKVLSFTDMFVEKVLKAEGEVDFETRLKLENSVRDMQDEEILNQWNKFVNSQTEAEAQTETKNLLGILIDKIKVE